MPKKKKKKKKAKSKILGVSFSRIKSTSLSRAWIRSMGQFNAHSEGIQPELRRQEAESIEDAQRMIIG